MQFIAVAVPSENQIRRQSALRMEAQDNFGRLIDGKFSAAGNKRLGNKPRTCRCHAVQRNGVAFFAQGINAGIGFDDIPNARRSSGAAAPV